MEEIKEWVYDPSAPKKKMFMINSSSVKKCLDKAIKKQYMNSGMFFKWSRTSPETFVEKSKRFNQKNFMRGFAKKNVDTDQQMVADLGFFDQDNLVQEDNEPLDPIFSQSQPAEETKDPVMEEEKEPAKKHPSITKTKEEVEANFTDADREKV